jgi:hypothetical protein
MTKSELIVEKIVLLLLQLPLDAGHDVDAEVLGIAAGEAHEMAYRAYLAKTDPTWWKIDEQPHLNDRMARIRLRLSKNRRSRKGSQSEMSAKFDRWIEELRKNVVEGEYGYEPGEFEVYPSEWRALYKEGLSPSQAFRRVLNSFAGARRQEKQTQRRQPRSSKGQKSML